MSKAQSPQDSQPEDAFGEPASQEIDTAKPRRARGPVASKSLDQAQARESQRLGKDMAVLVEHPFATLSLNPGTQAIATSWDTCHPISGENLRAEWRVEGSIEFGLPTCTDERVYLVLMEITREQELSQSVTFTRYDLLNRLGWATDRQASYENLREAFQRLASVTISSRNVFWDARAQSFYDAKFSLIDNYEIFSEPPGRKRWDGGRSGSASEPQSRFKWNDVIHQSMTTGQIRTLDLNFALSLEKPASLRLARFLDKKTHDGKTTFEIELHRLCELHMGMTPAYPSQLKQRLEPAHDELKRRGFIAKVTYGPMKTRKGEKVSYSFPREKKVAAPRQKPALPGAKSDQMALPGLAPASETTAKASRSAVRGRAEAGPTQEAASPQKAPHGASRGRKSEVAKNQPRNLADALTERGVSPAVIDEFVASVPGEEIARQIEWLDERNPNDPAATLVTAIRQRWAAPSCVLEREAEKERREHARKASEVRREQESQHEARKQETEAERQARDLEESEGRLQRAEMLWQQFCVLDRAEQEQLHSRLAEASATEWLAARVARRGGPHELRRAAEAEDEMRPTGPLVRLWVDYIERCMSS